MVKSCSFTFTGADFYALASDAMLYGLKRQIAAIETRMTELRECKQKCKPKDQDSEEKERGRGELVDVSVSIRSFLAELPADDELLHVEVRAHDFEEARRHLTPSLSEEELLHYKRLEMQFSSKGKKSRAR